MLTESAPLSLTNAQLMPKMEIAPHATRDTTSSKEPVSSQPPTTPDLLTSDVEPGTGKTRSAFPAPRTGSRMLTADASLLLINAEPMLTTVTVPLATKDTNSRVDNASSQPSTTPNPLTLGAESGTGSTKFASLALTSGSSMLTKSVFPSLTNAQLMLPTGIVPHASRDTTSSMEPVSSLLITVLNLPISDAELGTGTTEFASSAQKDGSSMLTKFVSPSLTNAESTLPMETALPATRDTISQMDSASSQPPIMSSLLILDVLPGTGINKSASLAPITGSRMLMVLASLSLTTVLPMLTMETVLLATRDTTLSVEPVSSQLPTTPDLPTSDAPPGIGTNKSALLAPRTGSRTTMADACLSLINAPLMPQTVIVLHASRVMTLFKELVSSLLPTT